MCDGGVEFCGTIVAGGVRVRVCVQAFMCLWIKEKDRGKKCGIVHLGCRPCVLEDGWEHQTLGGRNVRQTDIKDIRYETPLCFTLLPTCPPDINCGPGRTPHSPELSSKETPGTGVLSIKYMLTDDWLFYWLVCMRLEGLTDSWYKHVSLTVDLNLYRCVFWQKLQMLVSRYIQVWIAAKGDFKKNKLFFILK